MRMTQIYGLADGAKIFLGQHVQMIPDAVCPKCGEVVTQKPNVIVYKSEKSAGMHDDGPDLKQYALKDERIVREVLNEYRPWSSGPCLFFDLIDDNDHILYGWTEEEIDKRI